MITFTSFAVRHGGDDYLTATRHHPDIQDELDSDIDMDEDDELGVGSSRARLTTPGETLTSAQAFMRYDLHRSSIPTLKFFLLGDTVDAPATSSIHSVAMALMSMMRK